ncbi:MAG: hypothetical protein KDC98_19155, partial [Planctomycetes bacterium]|nr:hypothetical protein [Planctomycetota bacterium]
MTTCAETRFVPNRGQWHDEVRYAVLGSSTAWLHDDGFTVRYCREPESHRRHEPVPGTVQPGVSAVLRTRFNGAAEVMSCEDRQPGVYHFLKGNDPDLWRTDVPAFSRVVMHGVAPGIDVMFRGNARDRGVFEYDLLLERGADLGAFVARCEGADSLRLDDSGRLCIAIELPSGAIELVQQRPVAWQRTEHGPRPLEVDFRLIGEDGYGFIAPELDPTWPAVVDPGVVWSTYLGGGRSDSCNDLAWVPGVAIWLAGWAGSLDFPTTTGAYRTTGGRDGFVARLDENGSALHYATYFGGSRGDEIRGIDLGPGNTPTIVGFTESLDLPISTSAYQPTYGG